MNIELDGFSLSLTELADIARSNDNDLSLAELGKVRMQSGRSVVMSALEKGEVVYGLTTGLGARSGDILTAAQLADFSMQTLRGRAQSIGTPLSTEIVRAAMAVRLNTLLTGAAGADPRMADCLLACLQHNLTPVVGDIGSTGVADLCWGATMGLALSGEGRMQVAEGGIQDAAMALENARISPLRPGPKDGLCIASHSSFVGAMLGLCADSTGKLMSAVQAATAMTMEAMRANLTPLDPVAAKLHPQRYQSETALALLSLLSGSLLMQQGEARRLQDPLSIRNAVHVHAAAFAALNTVTDVSTTEINSVTDNPLVDLESERILSCGNYYTAHLTVAAHTMSHALTHVATTQLARISKLLSARFSGLPQFLASEGSDSNGFAPVMKIAEALVARMHHDAMPVAVWPSVNAEGVEDIQSHAPLAIQSLGRVIESAQSLCAIEMIISAQAIEMGEEINKAESIVSLVQKIRNYSRFVESDRSIAEDVMLVGAAIGRGEFI